MGSTRLAAHMFAQSRTEPPSPITEHAQRTSTITVFDHVWRLPGRCVECAKRHRKPTKGAVGNAPYASKKDASAAIKILPECKGGEADDSTGEKRHKKKK
jgi:hypothetical protein